MGVHRRRCFFASYRAHYSVLRMKNDIGVVANDARTFDYSMSMVTRKEKKRISWRVFVLLAESSLGNRCENREVHCVARL